ncbi:MAG: hypothetical protein LQ341_007062 [Variospora aurantia]|nr:MAG: hypothetical protein LQ341_007062 [Variospora aurantia]
MTLLHPATITDTFSRVRKFVKQASLEATGAQEERVELNKRQPDEGDLFGIRAIQSGYFGGVAQSRPSSVAGSVSPEGSLSNTLLGSHASPKLATQSPMSSVTTLPLEARRSSPLAHKAMSSEDLNVPSTSTRKVLTPLRSTLAPSDAETVGRMNHAPAVNMFFEIPPSPVATSRPTTAYVDSRDRTPSGCFSSPHNGGQYAPLGAPQIPEQVRRSSARSISAAETHQPGQGYHSQSASIASGSSDQYTQDGQRSSMVSEHGFIAIPRRAAQDERRGSDSSEEISRSRGKEEWPMPGRSHPPRSSSRYNSISQMPTIHSQEDEATAAKQPNGPNAVGDWGRDIFEEINHSLQESKLMNIPSSNQRYNHHQSTLSDASSTYSPVHIAHRGSGRQISIDSSIQTRQSLGPTIIVLPSDSTIDQEGRSRESNVSSQEPASGEQSATGSQRNTKEFGEFYDPYWMQSTQGQASGQQGQPNVRPADVTWDGRRPAHMELKPETVMEVTRPMPSPSIGKAM